MVLIEIPIYQKSEKEMSNKRGNIRKDKDVHYDQYYSNHDDCFVEAQSNYFFKSLFKIHPMMSYTYK